MEGPLAQGLPSGAAPGADSQPYWRQRGWRVSAGFIALALAAGLSAVATQGLGGSATDGDRVALDHAQPLVKTNAGPGAATAVPGRKTGCRTDDRDTSPPRAAPQGVQWRDLVGTKVPTSVSAGPLLASGPLWWCFAHTPMGAVMAAHVIPTQISGSAWRSVAEHQVVAGPRRDFFVALRSATPDSPVPGRSAASYAGFSVMSYSAAEATVELLVKGGQGTLFSTEVAVRWDDGDWKVVPQTGGSLFQPLSTSDGSAGFLLWRS
ncbi:hypothetical protein [Streptomyces sp. NPDC050804]|uniref:hypothetical protein n=1 Tax=Streptomyces sp. NPDC050804 TaxID=3154745 RepID=UPI00343D6625